MAVLNLKLNNKQGELVAARNIEDMDITLLSKLTLGLFSTKITEDEKRCINALRNERDKFMHSTMLEAARLSMPVFERNWQIISMLLLDFADAIGDQRFKDNIQEFINLTKAENPDFSEIYEVLSDWCKSSKELNEKFEKVARSVEQLEDISKQQDQILTLLREQMAEMKLGRTASCDGTLLWKIDSYHRQKQDALMGRNLMVISEPFYTHRNGYRLCANVYLNGTGLGRGTHMSLFFAIMKGECDNLLEWPFLARVSMTLLDQETRKQNLKFTFLPDPESESFWKPTSEINMLFGSPLFVPHMTLESSKYVRDDALFIKIEVDRKSVV